MTRILHLCAGNLYGGIETALVRMARSRRLFPSIEPEFALCFAGRLRTELSDCGVPVHDVGPVRSSQPWTVLRARRRLRSLLAARSYDWAIAHAAWPQAVFGPALRAAGVPNAFWMHDAIQAPHWVDRWAAMTPPQLVISNSRFTETTVRRLYPRVKRREVIYLPLLDGAAGQGAASRSAVRASLDTPEDAVVIVQVSRLERWKGHSLHLAALGLLKDVPGWVCWQVGGPQRIEEDRYLEELRAQAGALGIGGRIHFAGSRGDVPALLEAADIHCQPNLGPEPFGITFIEAMSAGLPVVTTNLGAAPEIVDEQCGVLVEPGSARALSEALHGLIASRQERARMGHNARARASGLCGFAAQMGKLEAALSANNWKAKVA